MNLYEEYFTRRRIKTLKLVEYSFLNYFLFKDSVSNSPIQNWRILKIAWTSQTRHPGCFHVDILKPVHDGYRYMAYFDSLTREVFRWEEYETNIFKVVGNLRHYHSIVDYKDVFLNFWSIFIFVFDSWFSDQNQEVQNWLFKTIDPESSNEIRFKELKSFLKYLELKHIWVYNHWVKNVLKCIDNYGYWIFDI